MGPARQTDLILVVEDDLILRESIAATLRSWGYQAETASDGLEALEKIRAASPTLILSDLRMPRMGGLDLLKELQHELRSIRCIVISGEQDRVGEFEAITLGAFSCLEKPVYPERLKAEIESCLVESRPSHPAAT